MVPQIIKKNKITRFPMWFHNYSPWNNITWFTWHKSMHHDQIMESYTPLNNYLSNCVIKLQYMQRKEILLNLRVKCWNSAFNAQGLTRTRKNICSSNGGAQEKRKTGWNSVYHKNWWFSKSCPPLMLMYINGVFRYFMDNITLP